MNAVEQLRMARSEQRRLQAEIDWAMNVADLNPQVRVGYVNDRLWRVERCAQIIRTCRVYARLRLE